MSVSHYRSPIRDYSSEKRAWKIKEPRKLAEEALAHTVGSAVERAYRRGDSFEKRQDLMRAWSDFCLGAA